MLSSVSSLFTYLGVVSAFLVAYRLYIHIYIYFIHKSTVAKYAHGPGPPYALITGVTGDIGEGFASTLASQGFNLVIHGRSLEKVKKVEHALRAKYPKTDIKLFIVDAVRATATDIAKEIAKSGLANLNVTILVNNAGGTGDIKPTFKALTDYTPPEIDTVLNLNARFATYLTYALLPQMSRASPALILNVSSGAQEGFPYLPIYGGAKAYISVFSVALDAEMQAENLNIDVHSIVFGRVRTENHRKPMDLAWHTPTGADAARLALGKVGCGSIVIAACWAHWLSANIFTNLPDTIARKAKAKIVSDLKRADEKEI